MPQPPTPVPEAVLTHSDIDLLELAWAARATLALEIDASTLPTGATSVRLLDTENTPLALATLGARAAAGWTPVAALEPLQPLAPVPGPLGERSVRLAPLPGLAERSIVLTHRMPTSLELTTRPDVWVVLASRGDGPDRVAQAAVVGLRALRESDEVTGEVVVVPAWRPGRGLVRPADGASPVELAARCAGLGPVSAVIGTPSDDDGALAPVRTALAAAYPAGAVPALEPPTTAGRGTVILLTGLSGSGKSTVAKALAARLASEDSREVTLLDGDEVRQMLSAGLGFDRASRELNVTRIGYVAALVARHGGIAVAAPIAPFEQSRAEVRRMAQAVGDFVLVHVATALEVCEARDRKGLYARARAGEIPEFTGISSPYEAPRDADVVIDTAQLSVEAAVDEVLAVLRAK